MAGFNPTVDPFKILTTFDKLYDPTKQTDPTLTSDPFNPSTEERFVPLMSGRLTVDKDKETFDPQNQLMLFPHTPLVNMEIQNSIPFVPYKAALKIATLNLKDIEKNKAYGGNEKFIYAPQLHTPVASWIYIYDSIDSDINKPKIYLTNVLITVDQRPRIIKTEVIGRNGTVKTYVGEDDYQVTIEGYIDNKDGEGIYPRADMINLKNIILNQGKTLGIKVLSPFLNLFGEKGIDFLIVTDSQFPQEAGGYSQQKFTICAISDYYLDSDAINSPYYP